MGLFGALFDKPKKKSPEELQKIARGQSVVGNVLGSSPYMREVNSQKKEVSKDYKYREIALRKEWAREDQQIARYQGKKRDEFYRKYAKNPKDAERFFLKWKMEQDRKLQRERKNELDAMKWEKVDTLRDIPKNIKQYGRGKNTLSA